MSPSNEFSPGEFEEESVKGPWIGLGVGFVLIAAIVSGLIYSSRTSIDRIAVQPQVVGAAAQADPYAANLQTSGIQLSQADNVIGGTVTYVEGTITNTGDKTVSGATVEVTFKNTMSQVVQRQNEQLWVVQSREPAVDVATLAANPLKPGDKREFRLSFERISADWDRQPPAIRFVVVTTR
jgi:Protein of unknown function (DUF2393)